MNRLAHQEGMTLISWLVIVIGIGVAALVAIRLVPIYIESYTVGSILQTMEGDPGLRKSTRQEVRQTFGKRLDMNNIEHGIRNNLKINKVLGGLQLIVDYQARVHLLGNLDAVASFRKEAMIRN
ncbi:MAG: DUF4845 domain-containing protein [Nitrococcus sp.]|nr:DUF4845 domain-containing protein [Nitrococcus sp.]